MKKWITIIVIIWLCSGLIAAGLVNADCGYYFTESHDVNDWHESAALSLLCVPFGLFSLFMALIATDFGRHGFTLWGIEWGVK